MDVLEQRGHELNQAVKAVYKAGPRRPVHFFENEYYSFGEFPHAGIELANYDPKWCDWYIWKAMTTVGTEAEFKFILPRLIELMVQQDLGAIHAERIDGWKDFNSTEWWLLSGKLLYARFTEWPKAEREPILDLYKAVLQVRMVEPVVSWDEFYAVYEEGRYLIYAALQIGVEIDWIIRAWVRAYRSPQTSEQACFFLLNLALSDLENEYSSDYYIYKQPYFRLRFDRWLGSRPFRGYLKSLMDLLAEKESWLYASQAFDLSEKHRAAWKQAQVAVGGKVLRREPSPVYVPPTRPREIEQAKLKQLIDSFQVPPRRRHIDRGRRRPDVGDEFEI